MSERERQLLSDIRRGADSLRWGCEHSTAESDSYAIYRAAYLLERHFKQRDKRRVAPKPEEPKA